MYSFLNGVAAVSLFVSANIYAQQPSPDRLPAPVPSKAIDPLLAKPVDQLTPSEIASMQKKLADWPQLSHYRDENASLPVAGPGRVVFFGDSITDAWAHRDGNSFFPGRPYINRGISGQTTPQLLTRFQQDVVTLKPAVVVILAGINDIAGNTGESTVPMMEDNLKSMVQIAHANGIRVVLSSILPAISFPWRKGISPGDQIRELNAWMQVYARTHSCVYLDYYTAMADKDGGMRPGLSKDNVHPTPAGYAIMAPLAEKAIALARR
jgi:lysophospholipase L1-like esterase